MNSNVPFNIGMISFCKSEEEDTLNDLLTEHFIDCACSTCIDVEILAIVLKISLDLKKKVTIQPRQNGIE